MNFKPKLSINTITFSGGQTLTLDDYDKVLIVGPNNSGKSQTLRDIMSVLQDSSSQPIVIKDIEFKKEGTNQQLDEFIKKNGSYSSYAYNLGPARISQHEIALWESSKAIYSLSSFFIKNITAKERLNICDQQKSIAYQEPKTKPQHILYDDSELMEHVSTTFKKAFNKDLAFDYRGGSNLPIYLIDKTELPNTVDRVSNEYINVLRNNPLLDQQGDGIKGYAGILFETMGFRYDISLIDEPEAFLHPPQMRRLGYTLAQEVKGQLIVATHSSDIMRGFLEGTKGNLKILRIKYKDGSNIIHEVNQDAIKELWSKPNLRYSNALDGIFHEQVIICEDDSDCRLINYVADYLTENNGKVYPDTSFVPSGGKHAIAGIVNILRQTGVPVKAIYDFDLLSERNTFAKALDAFGCPTSTKESLLNLWSQINSEVLQKTKAKNNEEIKDELLKTLSQTPSDKISKSLLEDIFKQKKPWSEVKKHGVNGLPSGNIRGTFKELNQQLKKLGIYLVPVGEIENFSPETGLHGPNFVSKFLSERKLSDPELRPLLEFVDEIYNGDIVLQEEKNLPIDGDKVAIDLANDE
ncbi:ATP-dependent nuclease [Enterobacter cloacae]